MTTQVLYQVKGDFIHDDCAESEKIDKEKLVQTSLGAVDADDICAVCGEPALRAAAPEESTDGQEAEEN